jgi:hypothetical protein
MTAAVARRDEFEDLSIVPSVPMQRVQTEYTTALSVQKARALPAVQKASLDEAAILGADGYYAWGAGKDRIEGPSKELAMCLVRCWGNCAVDLGEVQDFRDSWIFTAKFIDLETGFTLARQFRQSKKWTVYGKFDEARKEDIRFQIGQSKAVRNVILNALPGWLVRRAIDKCKGGVREGIEKSIEQHSMEKVQDRAMERLAKLNVPADRVLVAMGRQAVRALTVEDLVILHGNIACLENGSDTIDTMFPLPEAETQPKRGSDALRDKLAAKDKQPEPETPADPAPGAEQQPAEEQPANDRPSAAESLCITYAEMHGITNDEAGLKVNAVAMKQYNRALKNLNTKQLKELSDCIGKGMFAPES